MCHSIVLKGPFLRTDVPSSQHKEGKRRAGSLTVGKMMRRSLQLTRLFGFVNGKQMLSGFLSTLRDTHFDQDVS
jgi:hypothetical protein